MHDSFNWIFYKLDIERRSAIYAHIHTHFNTLPLALIVMQLLLDVFHRCRSRFISFVVMVCRLVDFFNLNFFNIPSLLERVGVEGANICQLRSTCPHMSNIFNDAQIACSKSKYGWDSAWIIKFFPMIFKENNL